jgi:hypothetical protein
MLGRRELVPANNLEQKQLNALKGCVKSLYNINPRTFTPVAPGSNGYFYGLGGPSGCRHSRDERNPFVVVLRTDDLPAGHACRWSDAAEHQF